MFTKIKGNTMITRQEQIEYTIDIITDKLIDRSYHSQEQDYQLRKDDLKRYVISERSRISKWLEELIEG